MFMKKYLNISLVLITSLFVFFIIFFIILRCNLDFKLIGKDTYEINVFDKYVEEGFKAKLFDKNVKDKVKIKTDVNYKTIGNYVIEYRLKVYGVIFKLERFINVVDNEKPVITLKGDKRIYLYKGDEYVDNGFEALDNYDGDITKKVKVSNNIDNKKSGEYEVKYTVRDSSGNKTTIKRIVIVSENAKTNINNPMIKYIEDNNYDISFGYYNLVTKDSYFYNENKVYFAASLVKAVEALYLYENDMVTNKLKPYIKKSITVSDNDAHHYIQNYIGQSNLKEYGKKLGAKYLLEGGSCCGQTTVNDQLIFWKKLYKITKDKNDELKSWFMNDHVNCIKFDENIPVMHKYGSYGNVFHDVGIIFDDEPYIVIILTGRPNGYKKVVNKLSNIIYDYHLSKKSDS